MWPCSLRGCTCASARYAELACEARRHQQCKFARREQRGILMNALRTRVAMVLALALSVGIAQAQTKIKPGFNLFSPQDDVQVGQQSAAAAEQQLPILRDASVQAYVNRIGQRLAAN